MMYMIEKFMKVEEIAKLKLLIIIHSKIIFINSVKQKLVNNEYTNRYQMNMFEY